MDFATKLVVPGCLGLLALSVYPGVMMDLVFFGILLVPLVACALIPLGVVYLEAKAWDSRKAPAEPRIDVPAAEPKAEEPAPSGRWGAGVMLVVAVGLVAVDVPRRIAFYASSRPFELYATTAPESEGRGEPLGRFLGVYHVDRYAADPRGGVYFRTHSGPDGIGPDQMSYGFAPRPNTEGSPFGNSGYRVAHLFGDWFTFAASDDW